MKNLLFQFLVYGEAPPPPPPVLVFVHGTTDVMSRFSLKVIVPATANTALTPSKIVNKLPNGSLFVVPLENLGSSSLTLKEFQKKVIFVAKV